MRVLKRRAGEVLVLLSITSTMAQCRSTDSRSSSGPSADPRGEELLEGAANLDDKRARDFMAQMCESCHTGNDAQVWTMPLGAADFAEAMRRDPALDRVRNSLMAYLTGALGAMPPDGGGADLGSVDRGRVMALINWLDRQRDARAQEQPVDE